MLQPTQSPADLSISRYLLPRLIAFVTNVEPEDPEQARSLVAHTLSSYIGTAPSDKVPAAMSLIIPTLMTRATAEGTELYQETSARLLEIAAVDQGAFRGVVGALSSAQRTFLEEVIRSGRQGSATQEKDSSEGAQPTIALKMNFGE